MELNTTVLIVLGVLNLPLYLYLGKFFFGSWDGFGEAIAFFFTPDVFSFFRGEGFDDLWAELKLFLFVFACGACLFGEYRLFLKFFA